MPTVTAPQDYAILLDNIRWSTYEALRDEIGERHVRLTYDDGSLEIMTLSHGHENYGRLIGRLIGMLTLELGIAIRSGGSNTLKRKSKKKGLEPDECFWIKNEAAMRGNKHFDIKKDPPPDLAVEIDISRSSLDRMPIYAAMGIPEIWRFDGTDFEVHELRGADYHQTKQSASFLFLPLKKIAEVLTLADRQDETSLVRSFVAWVRSDILPVYEADKHKKRNGRKKDA